MIKLCLILLSLLILGQESHAQYHRKRYPKIKHKRYKKPKKKKVSSKDIQNCNNYLKALDLKTIIPSYTCKNTRIRSLTKTENASFTQCLLNLDPYSKGLDSIFNICSNSNRLNVVSQDGFVSCLESIKDLYFAKQNYLFCSQNHKVFKSDSESFGKCLEYLNKDRSDLESAKDCVKEDKRLAFSNPEKIKCIDYLVQNFSDKNKAISYCNNNDLTEVNKAELNNCKSIMQKNNFDNFHCLDKEISSKIDESTISCVQEKKTPYYGKYGNLPTRNPESMEYLLKNCVSKATIHKYENDFVKYNNLVLVHHTELFDYQRIGGLSGLTFDGTSNILYAVSDNTSNTANLVYKINIINNRDVLNLEFKSKIELETERKFMRGSNKMDSEGIAIDKKGNLIISTETLFSSSSTFIKLFNSNGEFLDNISLTNKFTPSYNKDFDKVKTSTSSSVQVVRTYYNWGVRSNRGFESLTISPSNKFLFTANESPLIQDKANLVRIVKLANSGNNYFANSEFLYPLENNKNNGLVDLLAIDDQTLYTLERGFDEKTKEVTSKIFKVILNTKSYLSIDSIDSRKELDVLSKELVLDLENLKHSFPKAFQKIDNIEGMSLGPKLNN